MSWLLGLASLATLLLSVLSYNYCRVTPYHTLCGYNGGELVVSTPTGLLLVHHRYWLIQLKRETKF